MLYARNELIWLSCWLYCISLFFGLHDLKSRQLSMLLSILETLICKFWFFLFWVIWKFLNVLFFCFVAVPSCDALHFQCSINITQCIPLQWLCDGGYDCHDHTDELNCSRDEHSQCDVNEFHCKTSHECIHMSWVCDGGEDCRDSSDELKCEIFYNEWFLFSNILLAFLKEFWSRWCIDQE